MKTLAATIVVVVLGVLWFLPCHQWPWTAFIGTPLWPLWLLHGCNSTTCPPPPVRPTSLPPTPPATCAPCPTFPTTPHPVTCGTTVPPGDGILNVTSAMSDADQFLSPGSDPSDNVRINGVLKSKRYRIGSDVYYLERCMAGASFLGLDSGLRKCHCGGVMRSLGGTGPVCPDCPTTTTGTACPTVSTLAPTTCAPVPEFVFPGLGDPVTYSGVSPPFVLEMSNLDCEFGNLACAVCDTRQTFPAGYNTSSVCVCPLGPDIGSIGRRCWNGYAWPGSSKVCHSWDLSTNCVAPNGLRVAVSGQSWQFGCCS